MISVVMIDSRSDAHPDWVGAALQTLKTQISKVDLVVIDNVGREKTIGEAFNEGVRKAKCDWVAFVGDDDWVSRDLSQILENHTKIVKKNVVCVTTNMTVFDDETKISKYMNRIWTGCWRRDYLLKHPFNEKLKSGIDREYIEETVKRGQHYMVLPYYFGYFYRKHQDYSCAGDVTFTHEAAEFYFLTANRIFLTDIVNKVKKFGTVFVDTSFNPELAKKAKVIFAEWASDLAHTVANFETDAKKILRIHAFEAFDNKIKYLDFSKFDQVIFVGQYILDYINEKYGIDNAVLIPNHVDTERFSCDEKVRNNKIAVGGYLTRKKGIGEIELIAREFPEYEFHLAGKYQEDDVADYFKKRCPDNVYIHPWQYELNGWFKDKTYVLSASLRESQQMTVMEGMAAGLKPLVRKWLGAEDIYEETWSSLKDLRVLLEGSYEPEKYRKFAAKYKIEPIIKLLREHYDSYNKRKRNISGEEVPQRVQTA